MDFLVTFMTANRAYSKAGSRLAPKFKELEQSFSAVPTGSDAVIGIIVMFVDQPPPYLREIRNKDRYYQVEVGSPERTSFRPADDETLLLALVDPLRSVIDGAPVSENARAECLARLSGWEQKLRRAMLRAV